MQGSVAATANDIAAMFGLRKYPRSWCGQCPVCEYSGNIFSVRAGREQQILLYCANGCDRNILAEAVALRVGQPAKPEPKPQPNDDEERRRKQERAAALWRSSGPARGTVAETYLRARGLPDLSTSGALRFRGDCPHPEGGERIARDAAA